MHAKLFTAIRRTSFFSAWHTGKHLNRICRQRAMSSQGVVQKNPVLTEIDINDYDSQLEEKRKRIEQLFAAFQPPKLQVFPSKPIHYRMRYVPECLT